MPGGIEGGMTNGEDVVVRAGTAEADFLTVAETAGKRQTWRPVNQRLRTPYERSDVCVVPAAGVVGEAMVALVLAGAMLEKFGGDSLGETRCNYQRYMEQVKNF